MIEIVLSNSIPVLLLKEGEGMLTGCSRITQEIQQHSSLKSSAEAGAGKIFVVEGESKCNIVIEGKSAIRICEEDK